MFFIHSSKVSVLELSSVSLTGSNCDISVRIHFFLPLPHAALNLCAIMESSEP